MKSVSYFIAALTLSLGVLGWWLGGVEWFLATGPLTYLPCIGIALVGTGAFIASFWKKDIAWMGADQSLNLGLLGTIAGLMYALPNVDNIDVATSGIALALLTTGFGLVSYAILYLHGWLLGLRTDEL